MHEVFSTCVKKGKHPSIFLDNVFNIEGEDILFDEDMVRWTTESLEWIQNYKRENKNCHILSEYKMKTGAVLSPDLAEKIWGTPDITIYSKEELLVFDLKGGYVDVSIEDNYQLILYAIGAIAHFEDAMEIPRIENIRLCIHQPRSGGAKQLLVSRETIDDWGEFLKRAAKEALLKNAQLRASDEACKWCPAIGACPAAHQRATELAQRTDWPDVVSTITEEQLVKLLDRAGFIRKFLDAAESYALSRLQNGYQIPGYKLVAKKKHRKWADEEKALKTFGAVKKAKTPAQVEKEFGKDIWKTYPGMVTTPEGEPELASAEDPRPTIPFRELKVISGG
jgi:hypothetical protein